MVTNNSGLVDAVAALLLEAPDGLTARQLAYALRRDGWATDKRDVNVILYRHRGVRFEHDGAIPPTWTLVGRRDEVVERTPYAVRGLVLHNWKVFEDCTLRLNDINLVFGNNSSGKSSLLQALLIMKQSWGHGSLALIGEFGDFADDAGDFENVVHGHNLDATIRLSAHWGTVDDGSESLSEIAFLAKARYDEGTAVYTHWIETIAHVGGDRALLMQQPWLALESVNDADENEWLLIEASFEGQELVADSATLVGAFGTNAEGFPDLDDVRPLRGEDGRMIDVATRDADELAERIAAVGRVLDNLVHIGPTRQIPDRRLALTEDVDTRHYLFRLEDPALLADVNEWLAHFEVPYRVSVLRIKGDPGWVELGLMRNDSEYGSEEVRLQDVGYGISQLLPIVVQLLGNREKTILIEEPEAHLHPRLQAMMAELFATSAKDYGNVLIVETHSEPLLLRLQRQIAEGSLGHEQVGLFNVTRRGDAAQVEVVTLKENGQLDYEWPGGFFDDRMDDLIAILDPNGGE